VIGGLIRESESTTVNKIPLLGDIPLLGYLFRTDEIVKSQAELMIFLTPFVVNDASELREMSRLEQAQLKQITPGDVKRHTPDWDFEPRD
jgi:general secretion pathway protein D